MCDRHASSRLFSSADGGEGVGSAEGQPPGGTGRGRSSAVHPVEWPPPTLGRGPKRGKVRLVGVPTAAAPTCLSATHTDVSSTTWALGCPVATPHAWTGWGSHTAGRSRSKGAREESRGQRRITDNFSQAVLLGFFGYHQMASERLCRFLFARPGVCPSVYVRIADLNMPFAKFCAVCI